MSDFRRLLAALCKLCRLLQLAAGSNLKSRLRLSWTRRITTRRNCSFVPLIAAFCDAALLL